MPASPTPEDKLLKIQAPHDAPGIKRGLIGLAAKPLERLLCFPTMNELYARTKSLEARMAKAHPERNFLDNLLDVLEVDYDLSDKAYQRIPREGPVVVVANHPFGAIEGVILAALLRSVRPDVKILANYFLSYIPDIVQWMIYVDPFGTDAASRRNIAPLKESLAHLKGGGMLGVFPAGEVAHFHLRRRTVMDPPWNPIVARLVKKTKAPVLPIFFQGRNSLLFQAMGCLHPRCRTVMLPRELINKCGGTVQLSVGSPISYKKLEHLGSDDELMAYLRLRTYMLKDRPPRGSRLSRLSRLALAKAKKPDPPQAAAPRVMEPVAESRGAKALVREIKNLPADALLHSSNEYEVYAAKAEQIPDILHEIGLLREHAFRAVGEGTGRPLDLDRFDHYYQHLFVWRRENKELVGAYRIGRADRIVAERGLEGLYTSTLFTFRPELFERLGPSLELGRSWVRAEYQKQFAPLLLLWKGIGQFVLKNPDHKVLFGPVSISSDYSLLSRELIVRHLRAHKRVEGLGNLVQAKTPPKLKSLRRHEVRQFRGIFSSMDDVTAVISDIETDQKGIPVLLKQYLKLGGKVLSFNVDPDFNDCLDGLLLVDLLGTDRRILDHYLGRENAENFLDYHRAKGTAPVA